MAIRLKNRLSAVGNISSKQYGPDSSGYYGELNGIGGLEGIIHGKTGDSMDTINSVFGDVAAYTYHGEAYFLEGSVDSYGRLRGDSWLSEESDELTDNTVFWVLKNSRFRGRRVEGNNLSNFGARHYNVETGSFLSADPYGHDGSLNLYSYADADPVNYVDPDGRLSQPVNEPIGARAPSAQQATAPKASFYSRASTFVASKLDYIQTSLDVVGMTPIYGNIADVANAAISGARGNWGEMSLNMAAAVPGIGIGVTAGKLSARVGGEVVKESRVFWSGGTNARKAAEAFAKQVGGITLEMTLTGKILDKVTTKRSYPIVKPLWNKASARFARGAGESVNVFQSGSRGVRLDSVWAKVEYPELIKKGTDIKFHIAP